MMYGGKQCLVRFEQRTETRHHLSNEILHEWNEFLEVWARLEPKRVSESVKLGSREVMVTHLLFADHDDLETVTADMRAVYEPTAVFKDGDDYLPACAFFQINGIKRDYSTRRRTEISMTEVDQHAAT